MLDEHEDGVADDEHLINLSFSLASDDVFLRRTCPECGLDFKTETSPDQYASLLNPAIHRVGREYGVDLSGEESLSEEEGQLHFPTAVRAPLSFRDRGRSAEALSGR